VSLGGFRATIRREHFQFTAIDSRLTATAILRTAPLPRFENHRFVQALVADLRKQLFARMIPFANVCSPSGMRDFAMEVLDNHE